MADNQGAITIKRTLSYIVGCGKVAIIDLGPNDSVHIGAGEPRLFYLSATECSWSEHD